MLGQTISHYTILKKIGSGGMGVVYEAQDTRLGRHVALKFLPEVASRNKESLQRFRREARAASMLEHPYICATHDVDEFEGKPFIVMQLLRGQLLNHLIQQKSLDTKTILRLGVQVASALSEAHKHGIIHRDLKPSNIFVTDLGDAKVLDFGLAKLSETHYAPLDSGDLTLSQQGLTCPGIAMGTAPYMSPEQALGEELDARSDIFSLGITLYEMATGTLPFSGSTPAALSDALLNKNPVRPCSRNACVPPELDALIIKALQKEKGRRFQSAETMEAELKKLQLDVDSGQLPTSGRRLLRRYRLSARRWWAAALVVFIVLPILFLVWKSTTAQMVPGRQVQQDAKSDLGRGIVLFKRLSEGDGEFKVIEAFRSAITADPSSADAFCWLSKAYWRQGIHKAGHEDFDKAWGAVETAIRLNANLAEAHRWKARMQAFYRHDWKAAEEEYQKAQNLDPGMLPHADYLLWRNRPKEALQSIKKSLEPGSNLYFAATHCEAGWNYYYLGEILAASKEAQEAINLDEHWAPAYWLSGWCGEKLGREQAVVRYTRYALQYEKAPSGDFTKGLVNPYVISGMKGFWQALVTQYSSQVHPYHQAAIYIKLKNPKKAMDILFQLSEFPLEQPLVADARFDPIRKDPRYHELMQKFGLNP